MWKIKSCVSVLDHAPAYALLGSFVCFMYKLDSSADEPLNILWLLTKPD
jgi:hypothetical protein